MRISNDVIRQISVHFPLETIYELISFSEAKIASIWNNHLFFHYRLLYKRIHTNKGINSLSDYVKFLYDEGKVDLEPELLNKYSGIFTESIGYIIGFDKFFWRKAKHNHKKIIRRSFPY